MFTWATWSVCFHLFQVCVVTISGLSSSQIEDIVSEHNAYRRLVAQRYNISNMNRLNWSDTLRQTAEQLITCSHRPRRLGGSRESRGRSSSADLRSIVNKWYEESRHYVPQHQACLPWNSCDRFRRMVNAEQTHVGCSLESCGRRAHSHYVMLCLYQGGSEDSFSFKSGSSCTHCGDLAPFCENSLCVPCNKEETSCDCRKSCHRDGIGNGTLNSSTCTCTCQYGLGPNCDMECKNPELYEDYDYCGTVSEDECNDPDVDLRATLREYCPEQCACRPYPLSSEGT